MVSEISYTEKDKYHMVSFCLESKKQNKLTNKTETNS